MRLANVDYVHDDNGEYADADSEGELCVDGPTVMSGYWGSFGDAKNCWATTPGSTEAKAYRTGDYAKQRADGHWLYFGRRDNMVKIWGYRVELGEIESCLLARDGVEQAAVVKVTDDKELGDSLVAFLVSDDNDDDTAAAAAVIKYCRQNLPPYMCPKTVHFLGEIPLSHNGKIERRELATRAAKLATERSTQ